MFANKEVFRQYLGSIYRSTISFQQYLMLMASAKNNSMGER